MASCNCELCVEMFDEQKLYSFGKRKLCSQIDFRGPSCKCFEQSQVTMDNDFTVEYQNHTVCTECKYDSHCQLFNPNSYCYEEGNTTPDGQ